MQLAVFWRTLPAAVVVQRLQRHSRSSEVAIIEMQAIAQASSVWLGVWRALCSAVILALCGLRVGFQAASAALAVCVVLGQQFSASPASLLIPTEAPLLSSRDTISSARAHIPFRSSEIILGQHQTTI